MSKVDEDLWSFSLELPPTLTWSTRCFWRHARSPGQPDPFNDLRRRRHGTCQPLTSTCQGPADAPDGRAARCGTRQADAPSHRNNWLLADGSAGFTSISPVSGPTRSLLVVYDAQELISRAAASRGVDNLVAQRRIEPIALALVGNSKTARAIEYACNEATIGFVMTECCRSRRSI